MKFWSLGFAASSKGLLCGVLSVSLGLCQAKSSQDPVDQRVDVLLSQMTLAEKLGQMSQAAYMAWRPDAMTTIRRQVKEAGLGSVLNVTDQKALAELQDVARNQTRLGIPLLVGMDVIHGYRTQFPIPLGQAATWNPELVKEAAAASAREALSQGIAWTFSPMIDISRDPRWGRIAESAGEDPLLSARMGVAMVEGYQAMGMAACAKHFAGYGAAEAGRDYNTTLIPETELRNVYLRPFRAVQQAGVMTFMSAFNDLNGTPATANRFLLRRVLREEWGFSGFVVSDWEAVLELTRHGIAGDMREASRLALNAGVDMEMVTTGYLDHAEELLKAGAIDLAAIDDSVRRILRVKFRLGLFEHPLAQMGADNALLQPGTLRLAQAIAEQSIVLLKNSNNTLPLNRGARIAVVGPLADAGADMLGTWECEGKPEDAVTLLQALRSPSYPNGRVVHAPGLIGDRETKQAGFTAALEAARESDVIVACVGESHLLSGEGRSRAFLNLPGAQEELIDALAGTGKPLVLVIFAGRPLVFDRAAEKASAILYAWHPGTMAGPALAQVLFGETNPSGKLPVTFPRTLGQVPLYYNHRNTGRPPSGEDIGAPMGTPQDPVGYSSRHLDVHSTPAYPFGFGLSYSTFEYSSISLSGPTSDGTREVSVVLRNTGTRNGAEVAQLYIQDVVASLTRPVRELKAFRRVELAAGASTEVRFELRKEDLSFYDAEGRSVVEPGLFRVWVGGDSTATLQTEFTQE
jgi:beta-glucosidase